jgi:hypothetical protein
VDWTFVRKEWGAITFVLTVIAGMIVVPLALYLANQGPGAVRVPVTTPTVSAARTPSPSPTASPSTTPTPTPKASASPSA